MARGALATGYIVRFLPHTVNRKSLPPSRVTIPRTRSLTLSTFSSVRSGFTRKMVSYSRRRFAAVDVDMFFSPWDLPPAFARSGETGEPGLAPSPSGDG